MPAALNRQSKRTPLTAAFVRSVKEPGKYHDGSGTGLFLLVRPNGARFWIQRLTIRGKRRELGLGSPPLVSLVNARERALDNKRLVVAGGDPLAEKRKAEAMLTFEEAARKAHEELAPTFKNPKDGAAFLTTLESYIFPKFGSVALPDVTSQDIRQAILSAREKAPEVARKLTYRISAVFKWGIAENLCPMNPATAQSLALPRVDRQVVHRKALPYTEVADCIKTIHASGAGTPTKFAIEFIVLTAARSGEVRMADWSEFDFHGASGPGSAIHVTWVIPAERMKSKREHRVPLSGRAIEILREMEAVAGRSGLVFPGTQKGKPLSDMTLSKLVKELGFDADVHGFRTSFKTWAQERTNTPREVSEAALAHVIQNKAEAAYARSDLFEKRRKLMKAWAIHLTGGDVQVLRISS